MTTLDVRLDGFLDPIGTLYKTTNNAVRFQYSADFLAMNDAVPISLSLPLTDEPYNDPLTRAYFNNLLQERDAPLQAIMERKQIARDDLIGLFTHLGKDCAGAISVLPSGAPPSKVPGNLASDYEALSDQKLTDIVEALAARRKLPEGLQDPSPLAGVQSKISLTLLPNGRFALPINLSGAPTTHIIKIPDRDHASDPKHEKATLELARLCGFTVADAECRKINQTEVLIITRFDRALNENGQITRIHQEDFAQALGLAPALKYQRSGEIGHRFDCKSIVKILDQTSDPGDSKLKFIAATFFDLLTGNVDGHAKNHAILYQYTSRPQLAPRYDLLPTRLDEKMNDELSYELGSAKKFHEINTHALSAFFADLGILKLPAQKRIWENLMKQICNSLSAELSQLHKNGMKSFADLIAANIRQLTTTLKLATPEQAQHRDAFILGGGGWANS
jgi:serine/threonine-protein kinase HipA